MSPHDPEPLGLLLHLAGPLQSWGTHSRYNERDTARFPTRSGVIGLLAACLGRRRGEPLDDLARLSLTTRTDRPGTMLRDLHTVGGGLPAKHTVTTAEGKKRPPSQGTLLSHRYYLADAAFAATLTGDPDTLRACAQALRNPVWPPYLGRRACPPEGPLLLGLLPDPLHHLTHLPLARPAGRDPVTVTFHGDNTLHRLTPTTEPQPSGPDGSTPVSEITDEPVDLAPRRRIYRARPLYQRTLTLPASQCGGLGTSYLTAISDYLRAHEASLQGPA
jgi:CRISPR system Cascade subunit CasD